MKSGKNGSDFFLSYARADKPLAAQVIQACANAGHKFWWDSQVLPGIFFRSVINRRIEGARAVVALWTTRSAVSPWVVSEAEHGHMLMKLINICGPGFPPEKIPKPFYVYNTLQWAELADLSGFLSRGYFGVHVQPEEAWGQAKENSAEIPFLEILDDLYFHHASVVCNDADTLQRYLRRFPNGRHVALAAKQFAELSFKRDEADKVALLSAELSDTKHRILELLCGVRHDGQPFWAYVAIFPSRYRAYANAKAAGQVDLLDFSKWGEISSAGVGEWPTHEENLQLAKKFNVDIANLHEQSSVIAILKLAEDEDGQGQQAGSA